MSWKGIVNKKFTAAEFPAYLDTLTWDNWQPEFIVLHNTASPNLAQRPNGLTEAHIQNFVTYYRDEKGWSGGPHLFCDDQGIWAFTPLTVPGVHSPSWNAVSIGIEMLGDYETESFTDGRGLEVQQNAVAAMAAICKKLDISPDTIRMHHEDPKTTHACPGKNVVKEDVIAAVKAAMQ